RAIAAVVAILDPDADENRAQAPTLAIASPPGKRPRNIRIALKSPSVNPVLTHKYPMSKKVGTAVKSQFPMASKGTAEKIPRAPAGPIKCISPKKETSP